MSLDPRYQIITRFGVHVVVFPTNDGHQAMRLFNDWAKQTHFDIVALIDRTMAGGLQFAASLDLNPHWACKTKGRFVMIRQDDAFEVRIPPPEPPRITWSARVEEYLVDLDNQS